MQAFPIVGLQVRLVGLLVVPGFVAPAGLHGRKNAHHARLLATLLQDLFDPIFFPEAFPAAHELDPDSALGCDPLHVCAQTIAQRLGPLWMVEDAGARSCKNSRSS